MPNYRYTGNPVRIYAGDNALLRLGDEVDRLRSRRALIICGHTIAHRANLLERIEGSLGPRCVGVFDGVEAGSPLPAVLRGVTAARESEADLLIAVGGGSAMVTTRAILILLAEGGTAHDHATRYPPGQRPISPRLMRPKLPNVVVATTPTTAATRAGTAVIDTDSMRRLELFDPKTRPAVVYWDTEAQLTAAPPLCVSSAAAVLSGVAAALQFPEPANPLAEADLTYALTLLRQNLPRVSAEVENGPVRLALCAAAFLLNRAGDSGAGANALGVTNGLAHALDTLYPQAGHGAPYAILTAPGMRFNRDYNLAGQARLASYLELRNNNMDDAAAAEAATEWLARQFQELGMPSRLSDMGVLRQDLRRLAADAMTDFFMSRNARPVPNPDDLEQLLEEVY